MKTAQTEQGARLKAARTAAGLTQAQVTQRLGLGANTVSQYERGDIGISDDRLSQMASLYGVDASQLAGRELTAKRDAAFYDGILHSLAVFNRASGELIAEVQRWREQAKAGAGEVWLSIDEIDSDNAVLTQLEDSVAAASKRPPAKKRKTGN